VRFVKHTYSVVYEITYLYSQVCLSLLGTFHGREASEKWDAKKSSLYQVCLRYNYAVCFSFWDNSYTMEQDWSFCYALSVLRLVVDKCFYLLLFTFFVQKTQSLKFCGDLRVGKSCFSATFLTWMAGSRNFPKQTQRYCFLLLCFLKSLSHKKRGIRRN